MQMPKEGEEDCEENLRWFAFWVWASDACSGPSGEDLEESLDSCNLVAIPMSPSKSSGNPLRRDLSSLSLSLGILSNRFASRFTFDRRRPIGSRFGVLF